MSADGGWESVALLCFLVLQDAHLHMDEFSPDDFGREFFVLKGAAMRQMAYAHQCCKRNRKMGFDAFWFPVIDRADFEIVFGNTKGFFDLP